MNALEITTGIIDKLQAENRAQILALHRAQNVIKHSERQLHEKDRLIKMLQDQLSSGTDGILEMSNKKKELTIKNLDLQVEQLLKEKEELELKVVKAESLFKNPVKTASRLLEKKTTQSVSPDRVKRLERIIELKEKRIGHLSKEVQRRTKSENDLRQKVYRLEKLVPMSRLPPEILTGCLLKEIQSLESQIDDCLSYHKLQSIDDLYKLKILSMSSHQTTTEGNVSKSTYEFESTDLLKIKLNVAERNIQSLENFIEQLQKTVQKLEVDNLKIKPEKHMVKSKALSETYSRSVTNEDSYGGSCSNTMKGYNEELKGRIRCLEEENSRLKTNIEAYEVKNIFSDVTEQEKTLLKSKLNAYEEHICCLQNNDETLQKKLKVAESEKNKLQFELMEMKLKNELLF